MIKMNNFNGTHVNIGTLLRFGEMWAKMLV